jgi:TIR domain
MARFFLSYRREDAAAYTHILYSRLQSHFSRGDVFMDVRSVRPGQDFVEAIVQTVRSCNIMITVIGTRWLGEGRRGATTLPHDPKDFVRLELETALEAGVHIVPVLVGRAEIPAAEDLPESLQHLRRLNAFALTDERLEEDVDRLVRSLEDIVVTRQAPTRRRALLAGASVVVVVGARLAGSCRSRASSKTSSAGHCAAGTGGNAPSCCMREKRCPSARRSDRCVRASRRPFALDLPARGGHAQAIRTTPSARTEAAAACRRCW